MEKSIKHFVTSDNLSLEIQKYVLSDMPNKIVLIVHGHGEHAGRYKKVAAYLNQQGISVYALTLRGHGHSGGKRGHAPSLNQLLLDVEYCIRSVRVDHLNAEIYLYGHSMGGNIVLNYLAKDQSEELKAAIVTSPWLRLAFAPPKFKIKLGNWLASIFPSLTQSSGLKPQEISSINEEVERYQEDPLIHSDISAMLFSSISKGADYLLDNAGKLKHQIFLAHGQRDTITSHDSTAKFAAENDFFTFKSYPNSKHEIHHDVDSGVLMQDISNWVLSN